MLHWDEAKVLGADPIFAGNAIQAHYDHLHMLHFGKPPERVKRKRATATGFLAFARSHNAQFRRRT